VFVDLRIVPLVRISGLLPRESIYTACLKSSLLLLAIYIRLYAPSFLCHTFCHTRICFTTWRLGGRRCGVLRRSIPRLSKSSAATRSRIRTWRSAARRYAYTPLHGMGERAAGLCGGRRPRLVRSSIPETNRRFGLADLLRQHMYSDALHARAINSSARMRPTCGQAPRRRRWITSVSSLETRWRGSYWR
jgi:hypothetical protein